MSCNIIVSSVFERSAKRLAKHYCSFRDDFSGFLTALKDNPFMGVDLGRGLRKVRMAVMSKGKGKSGGVRIISFLVEQNGDEITIELLDVYDKSETSTLSDKELRGLLKRCGLEAK